MASHGLPSMWPCLRSNSFALVLTTRPWGNGVRVDGSNWTNGDNWLSHHVVLAKSIGRRGSF